MLEGNKRALVDSDSFDDNNRLYPPATLNHIHSPEPGYSTQAALGFVDQYLSSNDVDLFEGVQCGKTTREKSPHVLNARGPLNLAKKIKARTKNKEKEPFNWVDSCQHDNRGRMFRQKNEASSNFGRYKQTYSRRKKGGNLQSEGNCSTSNTFDEKLGQGPRIAIENDNSLKELNVQPSSIRENADVYSGVTDIEDMSDIGLGTQIAAEAMNVLALMPPYGCQFNDTHQPDNALDGSLSDLTENEAHLKNSSNIQNASLHSITIKSNKKNASSSRNRETYTRRKKGGNLQSEGNCSTSNTFYEKLGQGPKMAIENDNSLKELNVQPISIRENANVYSGVTHIEDMPDIGLGTQIAAEAMNALALMPPYGCQFNETHQPENALDGSLSDLTENEAHLKKSSNIQNSSLHSITIKSNKKNASSSGFSKITYSSSCKHTDKQESDVVSGKMKKMMKGKSTAEGRFENNNSLPVCSKHVLLEEVCPLGEYTSFQLAAEESEHRNNESGHPRIKDQPSLLTEKNNNVKEKGIKHKRKGTGLLADPVKLGARTKRLKFLTDSCILSKRVRLNHLTEVSPQLSATRSFSWTDSWVYPKRSRGKRKGANMGTNLNAKTVLCIDGKENNIFSTRSIEDQANASCVDDGRCLLQGDFVSPGSSGDATKVQNWPDKHPLFLAHVESASNKSVTQSRSGICATVVASEGVQVSNVNHSYTEHHKKLCVKTLPKSSLLKELIRLGVPESMSDMMWKDLRHRRDMTDVRVLFSQHLDDSIIKHQTKVSHGFYVCDRRC